MTEFTAEEHKALRASALEIVAGRKCGRMEFAECAILPFNVGMDIINQRLIDEFGEEVLERLQITPSVVIGDVCAEMELYMNAIEKLIAPHIDAPTTTVEETKEIARKFIDLGECPKPKEADEIL